MMHMVDIMDSPGCAAGARKGGRLAACSRLALLSALSLAVLQGTAGADFCGTILGGPTVLGTGGASPFNSIISTSLLIMLFMINVSAFAYLIGYTFKIDMLTSMARAELGEVAITVAIVLISLGTFGAVVFVNGSPTGNFLAVSRVSPGIGVFNSDCEELYGVSTTAIGNLAGLVGQQLVINLFQGLTFSFTVTKLGVQITPFAGLSLQNQVVGNIMGITFALAAVPIAATMVMGVIYSLFPIFFYIGIILRTMPWTRAAGGAFLGLFTAFYIVFPVLLYLFVGQASVALVADTNGAVSIGGSLNPQSINIGGAYGVMGFDVVSKFIQTVAAQIIYVIFGLVISFIVSFDFMEAVGDLLGSPSLKSSQALKNLV